MKWPEGPQKKEQGWIIATLIEPRGKKIKRAKHGSIRSCLLGSTLLALVLLLLTTLACELAGAGLAPLLIYCSCTSVHKSLQRLNMSPAGLHTQTENFKFAGSMNKGLTETAWFGLRFLAFLASKIIFLYKAACEI